MHRMEVPVVWLEIFLLAALFVGLALGDDGKMRALAAALGGGFWTWWFWLGVAGLGLILADAAKTLGPTAVRRFMACWQCAALA